MGGGAWVGSPHGFLPQSCLPRQGQAWSHQHTTDTTITTKAPRTYDRLLQPRTRLHQTQPLIPTHNIANTTTAPTRPLTDMNKTLVGKQFDLTISLTRTTDTPSTTSTKLLAWAGVLYGCLLQSWRLTSRVVGRVGILYGCLLRSCHPISTRTQQHQHQHHTLPPTLVNITATNTSSMTTTSAAHNNLADRHLPHTPSHHHNHNHHPHTHQQQQQQS